MDRRIGPGIMLLGLASAAAIMVVKGVQHGWTTMPPMAAVVLALMVAVTALAWARIDFLAVIVALVMLVTATLFGLSIGFLIMPGFVVAVGALVTVIHRRRGAQGP